MSFNSKLLIMHFSFPLQFFNFWNERNAEIVNNAWNSWNKVRNQNKLIENKGIFQINGKSENKPVFSLVKLDFNNNKKNLSVKDMI